MRQNIKPVRKCHSCHLNLGDHCWVYTYPYLQWRHEHRCLGFENEEKYREFDEWKKLPDVKTRKELRREFFRTKVRDVVYPRKRRRRRG